MEIKKLFDLTGRTALVTGSNQGIGKAIALGLAEFGCNIILHCLDEIQSAEQAKKEIESFGVKAFIITADLSKEHAAEEVFAEAKKLHFTLDVLILNVSIQIRNAWQQVTDEEIDMQTATNFKSSLKLSQLFSKGMQEQRWGRILTIGSVQQTKPHPEMIVYSAMKAALSNMVKSLALQLAPYNITVNNIAPGVIKTDRNKKSFDDVNYKKQLQQKIPLNMFGETFDCAPVALLLCSEAGRYITGQDYFVDGGLSL